MSINIAFPNPLQKGPVVVSLGTHCRFPSSIIQGRQGVFGLFHCSVYMRKYPPIICTRLSSSNPCGMLSHNNMGSQNGLEEESQVSVRCRQDWIFHTCHLAVDNVPDEVQAVADHVTSANNTDGVIEAIRLYS